MLPNRSAGDCHHLRLRVKWPVVVMTLRVLDVALKVLWAEVVVHAKELYAGRRDVLAAVVLAGFGPRPFVVSQDSVSGGPTICRRAAFAHRHTKAAYPCLHERPGSR